VIMLGAPTNGLKLQMADSGVFRDGKPFGFEHAPDLLTELCQLGGIDWLARVEDQPSTRGGDSGGFSQGEGIVRHDLIMGEELKMDFAKMAVPIRNRLPGQVQPVVGASTFRLVNGDVDRLRLSGVMTGPPSGTKDQPRTIGLHEDTCCRDLGGVLTTHFEGMVLAGRTSTNSAQQSMPCPTCHPPFSTRELAPTQGAAIDLPRRALAPPGGFRRNRLRLPGLLSRSHPHFLGVS
jgi:hypothetical protein